MFPWSSLPEKERNRYILLWGVFYVVVGLIVVLVTAIFIVVMILRPVR